MRRLVEALNACWLPHFPGRPEITLADFKRDIRERQVWCSSCMIAFDGSEPIGVLIGAKRPHATLVDIIAVRPDRTRQGHGRHMLESLGAKLEILGPPLLTAEIPESLTEANAFFEACGYAPSGRLTDWRLDETPPTSNDRPPAAAGDRFIVPQGVADLAANGLLVDREGLAWDHAVATLQGRADRLAGLGMVTVDRIEAFVLYLRHAEGEGASIAALGPATAIEGHDPALLLAEVLRITGPPLLLPRVAEIQFPEGALRSWGFRPTGATERLTATRNG